MTRREIREVAIAEHECHYCCGINTICDSCVRQVAFYDDSDCDCYSCCDDCCQLGEACFVHTGGIHEPLCATIGNIVRSAA
jgi:hypothetical protein